MSDRAKLDVVDLMINVLREHERSLDLLIERLETVVQGMQEILDDKSDLSPTYEMEKTKELSEKVQELERQIREYSGREIAMIDALSSLYPMEQVAEISASA